MLNLRNISMKLMAAVLAAPVIVTACSVKESRIECPAELTIRVEVDDTKDTKGPSVGEVLVSVFRENEPSNPIAQKMLPVDEFEKNGFVARVPRGVNLRASVLAGIRNASITPVFSKVVEGEQLVTTPVTDGQVYSDSLYTFSAPAFLTAMDEHLVIRDSYAKDFFCIRFAFIGYDGPENPADRLPMGIRIRSRYDGLGVYTLDPVEKSYVMDARQLTPRTADVIVPRQGDDSLLLDFLLEDGSIMATVPLGELLRDKMDYDRTARRLKDIDLFEITYINANLFIKVNDWVLWSMGNITI